MYCLSLTIATDLLELAAAVGYGYDMTGSVEERIDDQFVKLTFYFAAHSAAAAAATSFSELLSVDKSAIEFICDNQDWNAKWRESMKPAQIANGVWVSPSWLEPPKDGLTAWIKIEPKMAFGTGHHETTRLAAKEIITRKEFIVGKSALDIGTGSGVLCFVADYAGAKRAIGVEIDTVCRANLAENVRDNPPRSGSAINFVIGTLDAININIIENFDAVIMNMLSTESVPLLARIASLLKSGSLLIWSGILSSESNDIINGAKNFGFELIGDNVENEWWCGAFLRG